MKPIYKYQKTQLKMKKQTTTPAIPVKDEKLKKLKDYWQTEFEKVTNYWYNKETPNMDKMEFILTHRRKAKQFEDKLNSTL